MKGIILAGGSGSRLYPLTKVINKHLLPVGDYPMIYYPILKMREAGINKVLVITGRDAAGSLFNLLGSGVEFGIEFYYRIQEKPGGIAQALSMSESFVGPDRSLVILGDNIFEGNLADFIIDFETQPCGAKILLKQTPDPERYGIAEIKEDRIISLEEKPVFPKSNYCVTGIYMYDSQIFQIIRELKPSARGELEITDVNKEYLRAGTLSYGILNGWWIDAGTWEAVYQANKYLRDQNPLRLQ